MNSVLFSTKNTFFAAFFTLLCLFAASSCDKIEGPYISQDQSVVTDVVFPDLDTNAVIQKVLMEEYTGQCCVNCPNGHRELEELSETFGEALVPIGLHVGIFAIPTSSFPNDFRTEEGTTLYNDFGVASIGTPAGVVNRKSFGGSSVLNISQWRQSISECAAETPVAAIQMINQYNAADKKLTAHTKTTIIADYEGTILLSLYIIEDGIVGPQKDGDEIIEDYVHQHVLRGSINGTYGTQLTMDGTVQKGESYTKSYDLDCTEKSWNIDNCSVIAILTDATTKEVIQVEKCPFK